MSQPCLLPITRTDGEQTWVVCPSSPSDELIITEPVAYVPPGLVGSLILGIVSLYLVYFLSHRHRLHQITAQLQQIIALERMFSLPSYRRCKGQNSVVSKNNDDLSLPPSNDKA